MRSLLHVVPCKGDWESIAKKSLLPLSVTEVRKTIAVLERLGMVAKGDDGIWRPTNPTISTGSGLSEKILRQAADQVRDGVHQALLASGVPHAVGRAGTLFSFFLGLDEAPVTFADAARQDVGLFRSFFHHMRERGVSLPPSAFESWFVSIAHDARVTERVVEAAALWRPSKGKRS